MFILTTKKTSTNTNFNNNRFCTKNCWQLPTQVALEHHYNILQVFNVLTWTKELLSPLNSTICSVSTKLATLPCTSMPLVKRRVPARKQQRRDTTVHKNGLPFSEHWLIETTVFSSLRKQNYEIYCKDLCQFST